MAIDISKILLITVNIKLKTCVDFNSRRWIEYADTYAIFPNGRRAAAGWNGWLHYVYDDPFCVRIF